MYRALAKSGTGVPVSTHVRVENSHVRAHGDAPPTSLCPSRWLGWYCFVPPYGLAGPAVPCRLPAGFKLAGGIYRPNPIFLRSARKRGSVRRPSNWGATLIYTI